ncbi:hypothetical protein CsatB_008116 [Cannabis sativa]|uniref:VQ domain-containing protein n=1 Tax=Cannabis sativa TaxID=3483 RepID=A0A7J6E5G1_CANSA|nr:hypothetical protein G4B88_026361 [Cannabis sativa]KAF4388436.1 hypothetical protein F8388_012413 [Cannabis sativa]
MDNKSCQSSGDSSSVTSNSSRSSNSASAATRDQYLKHLNKLSHKISKPILKKPTFDDPNFNTPQSQAPSPTPPPPPPPPPQTQTQNNLQPQQHQHQPPVYNINKNDFRDVVQKLTGSPAHERFPAPPPPIHQPKAASSRLQRIRPPPLAHLTNRPPPTLLNSDVPPPQQTVAMPNFGSIGRPLGPLSPLPPLPAVHGAAESPVSAYMRFLHNSMSTVDPNQKQASGFSPLAPLVSPRWSNFTPQQNHHPVPPSLPQQQQQPQGMLPPPPAPSMMPSNSQFQFPTSPLPFGCLNSPKSQYNLLSPSSGQLGFPQLPLSPSVPVPSPRWRSF